MASVINAVSGSGITQTADGSGIIKVQSSGVTTNALAWVNFDGTAATPITPRANYNISSVTKSATGSYVLNFTSALTDTNYVVCGSAKDYTFATNGTFTTSSVPIQVFYASSTGGGQGRIDEPQVCVAIFGN